MRGKKRFELGIHVTYTETSMCHRFVSFEIAKNYQEDQKAKEALDDYIRSLYRDEQGALLYHKIQEGQDQDQSTDPTKSYSHPIQNLENL